MTEFTKEFIKKQKKLLKFPLMPSDGDWVEIKGRLLIGHGNLDEETNSCNCAPYLTVEIEEDAETVKNCVLYYRESLDEIERLQERLLAVENNREHVVMHGKEAR